MGNTLSDVDFMDLCNSLHLKKVKSKNAILQINANFDKNLNTLITTKKN